MSAPWFARWCRTYPCVVLACWGRRRVGAARMRFWLWRIACGRLVPEWGKWRDVWAVVSVLHSRRHPLVLFVMSAGCAVVQLPFQRKVQFVCDEGLVVLSARVPVLLVHSEAVMPSCR